MHAQHCAIARSPSYFRRLHFNGFTWAPAPHFYLMNANFIRAHRDIYVFARDCVGRAGEGRRGRYWDMHRGGEKCAGNCAVTFQAVTFNWVCLDSQAGALCARHYLARSRGRFIGETGGEGGGRQVVEIFQLAGVYLLDNVRAPLNSVELARDARCLNKSFGQREDVLWNVSESWRMISSYDAVRLLAM